MEMNIGVTWHYISKIKIIWQVSSKQDSTVQDGKSHQSKIALYRMALHIGSSSRIK